MIDEGIGVESVYLPSSQDSSRDEFSEKVSTFVPVCERRKKMRRYVFRLDRP